MQKDGLVNSESLVDLRKKRWSGLYVQGKTKYLQENDLQEGKRAGFKTPMQKNHTFRKRVQKDGLVNSESLVDLRKRGGQVSMCKEKIQKNHTFRKRR